MTTQIIIPKKWGSKNPQVNQLMTQKAKSLIRNISKTNDLFNQNKKGYTDVLSCFEKYLKSFEKSTEENKMFSEESHLSIKKKVLRFVMDTSSTYKIDYYIIKNIWKNIR